MDYYGTLHLGTRAAERMIDFSKSLSYFYQNDTYLEFYSALLRVDYVLHDCGFEVTN